MRIVLLLASATFVGCTTGYTPGGTAVGNPTDLTAHVAPATEATVEQATARVSTLSTVTCDGARTTRTIASDVDLLGRSKLELPAGSWCGLELTFESPLVLSGRTLAGEAFTVSLAIDTLALGSTTAFSTDTGSFLVELGAPGWLDAKAATSPGSSSERELTDAILALSQLFVDTRADGSLDDAERKAGAVASTVEAADGGEEGPDDTGHDADDTASGERRGSESSEDDTGE